MPVLAGAGSVGLAIEVEAAEIRDRAPLSQLGRAVYLHGQEDRAMWPLTGLEIVNVCAGSCAAPGLAGIQIAGVQADGTPPEPDDLFVALREPSYDFDGHGWVLPYLRAGARLALVAVDWPVLPTLPLALRQRCIVVPDSLRAFRELTAWLRRKFSFPVIAVGGSNGKTTTKDMIAALLSGPGFRVAKTQGNLNGYTGIPLTLAQRANGRAAPPHALVVEVGIDSPRAMADHAALLAPEVAVLTALGPEHLAGLGSWEAAAAEELILFEAAASARRVFQARDAKVRERLGTARPGDILVCDEDQVAGVVRAALGRACSGGDCEQHLEFQARQEIADLSCSGVSLLAFRVSCPAPLASEVELTYYPASAQSAEPSWLGHLTVPMPGRHNADNLAAAFGSALAVGRSPDDLLRGWSSFEPPAMRCQATALPDEGLLIDDTYNASPASMAAAFALLGGPAFRSRRKVLILGDMLDLGRSAGKWHRALCEPLRSLENAHVFLFGEAMREVYRVLGVMTSFVHFLPADADPCTFLTHPCAATAGAVVLVKGSRGMRLDRVVAEILRRAMGHLPQLDRGQAPRSEAGRWELQFSD